MPASSRGVQSHLEYWLYGIVKVSAELGNARGFLRAVQEETIRKLVEDEDLTFPEGADPLEVLKTYNRRLDARGILDADDIAYHRKGRDLTITIGASCPYRSACNWLHEEKVPLPCFRAIAMGELLRLAAHESYDGRLTRFDLPCHITLNRGSLEASGHGD